MPSEQDIRELCAKLILAQGDGAFESALAELRTAIREHMLEAENRSVHLVLEMKKLSGKIKNGTRD